MKEIEVDDVIMGIDDLLYTKEKETQYWYDEFKSIQDDLMEICKESDKLFMKLDADQPVRGEDYGVLQSLISASRYFWDPNRDEKRYE